MESDMSDMNFIFLAWLSVLTVMWPQRQSLWYFKERGALVWSIKSLKDYWYKLSEFKDFILFNAVFPEPWMEPNT